MNECNTWQCINSFAAWFSAGGTILISSVALWLSLRDKLIRVRATFSGALIASYDPMKLDTYVYSLNFVNVGARDVSITNFEWRTKDFPFKKSCRIFIQPYLDERVSRFCTKLPLKLGDGESGQIFFASDFIEIMDEPNQFLFNENKLIAFMRIFMSEIYLCTSIGSVIKVQMRLEIKKELWGKYIAAMHKPKVRSK